MRREGFQPFGEVLARAIAHLVTDDTETAAERDASSLIRPLRRAPGADLPEHQDAPGAHLVQGADHG